MSQQTKKLPFCACREMPVPYHCTSCHLPDRNAGLNPAAYRGVVEALTRFTKAMEQSQYPELQGVWTDADQALAQAKATQ